MYINTVCIYTHTHTLYTVQQHSSQSSSEAVVNTQWLQLTCYKSTRSRTNPTFYDFCTTAAYFLYLIHGKIRHPKREPTCITEYPSVPNHPLASLSREVVDANYEYAQRDHHLLPETLQAQSDLLEDKMLPIWAYLIIYIFSPFFVSLPNYQTAPLGPLNLWIMFEIPSAKAPQF